MKKRMTLYLLVGLLAFCISLVGLAPAGWAYALLRPHLQGLTLDQVEGTLWRGSAEQGTLGPARFGPLHWHLRAWRLAVGRLEADVDVHLLEGDIRARIGGALLGDERDAADVQGQMPLASAMELLDLPAVGYLEGRLTLDLARVAFSADRLSALEGVVDWHDAAVRGGGRIALGDYGLRLRTEDSRVLGTIADRGGPLRARGELTLEDDGRYRIGLTLTPTTADTEQLVPLLSTIAKPGAGKSLRIEHSGSLALPDLP